MTMHLFPKAISEPPPAPPAPPAAIHLTDEEREAIEWAIVSLDLYADEMALSVKEVVERQATLRNLLARLHT